MNEILGLLKVPIAPDEGGIKIDQSRIVGGIIRQLELESRLRDDKLKRLYKERKPEFDDNQEGLNHFLEELLKKQSSGSIH